MRQRHTLATIGVPALSGQIIRDTYPNLQNRSVLLRLMDHIIAVLLAITMAIFPISVGQAAAVKGSEHAVALDAHHTHDEALVTCDSSVAATCSDHHTGNHDGTSPGCCGIGVCHAFQASAAPAVYSPHRSAVLMALTRDEQVDGIVSGRLDRPPRTV
jgi:hypothetical protein